MVEKSSKNIEVKTIKLEIEITEDFYNKSILAMQMIKEQQGIDYTIGEYLEGTIRDFITVNRALETQLNYMETQKNIKKENRIDYEPDGMYG